MGKKFLLLVLISLFAIGLQAQQLLSPSLSFSKKKTAYITLENGDEIEGILSNVKRKKGLIKLIKIKDASGNVQELKPESLKFMYLPPSGFDKLNKAMDFVHDAQKWNDEKLNQDFLHQGYVYFETVDVVVKKETLPMLMQLLNPTFSKKAKIYHDPYAQETMSVGVGDVKVAGGIDKSYYIKLEDDAAAYRIKKKDYKKEFKNIWNKCSTLSEMEGVKWRDLVNHTIQYTECK